MATSDWATQQLAEFLAVLTGAADDREAETHAIERLAESFEADAGAFIKNGRVTSSLGWPSGRTPTAELIAAMATDESTIDLSGVGRCETAVIPVDRDEGTTPNMALSNYRTSAPKKSAFAWHGKGARTRSSTARHCCRRTPSGRTEPAAPTFASRTPNAFGTTVADPTKNHVSRAASGDPRRHHLRRHRAARG